MFDSILIASGNANLRFGVSRFRQRIFLEDGFEEFSDDDIFSLAPVKIKLLFSEFCPPDAERTQQMISASKNSDSVLLEELLRSPQDPNVEDESGNRPLHHAAQRGDVKPVQLLLEASAEKDLGRHADGLTPLHLASANAHTDIVRLLIDASADKDKTQNNGMTALNLAASGGHLDVVTFLIEAGADIHKARNDGLTALGMAAAEGHFDIVRLLLEHGADVHSAGRGLDLALDMWKSFIC